MEKMRLLLLVDMPTGTRRERAASRRFGEFLFQDGFAELQSGVYTRMVDGRSCAELHEMRLVENQPPIGTVRLFAMTERQFRSATLVAGSAMPQETEIESQLDIFL